MKAKEMANNFIQKVPRHEVKFNLKKENLIDAVSELIQQFWKDFQQLTEARKIQENRSFIPLFKELDQKWNAVRINLNRHYGEPIIAPNGFREILKERVPEVYEYYVTSTQLTTHNS